MMTPNKESNCTRIIQVTFYDTGETRAFHLERMVAARQILVLIGQLAHQGKVRAFMYEEVQLSVERNKKYPPFAGAIAPVPASSYDKDLMRAIDQCSYRCTADAIRDCIGTQ